MRARNPLFSKIMMDMPYNGAGVVAGAYPDKTLKNAIYNNESQFKWISHTFTHALLTDISAANTSTELSQNHTTANSTIGMSRYFKDSMIQPEISGLKIPQFMTAAYNFGIRNILCDISYPECLASANHKPNTGYYVDWSMLPAHASGNILVIPRYAANLYYNVSTPAEWESEYNHFYAPGGLFATFPTTQTMADIVNREADNWLRYMMKYSIYSVMFHQSNLRAYDGTNSLLSKLMDATLNKYAAVFTLPIESPSQHDQAAKIIDRMTFNDAGVTGTIKLGATSNSVVFSSRKAARIPVTGIRAGTSVTYGGQVQSAIPIAANGTVTVAAPAW